MDGPRLGCLSRLMSARLRLEVSGNHGRYPGAPIRLGWINPQWSQRASGDAHECKDTKAYQDVKRQCLGGVEAVSDRSNRLQELSLQLGQGC
jgi:hypothetical protein